MRKHRSYMNGVFLCRELGSYKVKIVSAMKSRSEKG